MKKMFLFVVLFVLSFSVKAQQTQQIQTEEKDSVVAQKLDEVLIKAIRVEANAPITHSNVSKEELESRNLGQDLPILLNYLPSVVTTSDAGAGVGYTGIRVRGVSAASTNVTINGIPYNDAEGLGTFWVDLPDFSSSVESLQLQRGIGTSTNGSGAFGASINILTDVVSKKANGAISTSLGSYGTRKHTLKYSTGLLNNHVEISGRLSKIKSDGYIDRASSDLDSYFIQAAYVDDNTLLKALAFGGHEITYQAWYGLDRDQLKEDRTQNLAGQYTDADGNTRFYDNEVDNYKQDHYQLHWNEKLNELLSLNVGVNYTFGRGFYEQFKEDQDFATYGFTPIDLGGQTINTTDLIRRRWLDNDYYVFNTALNYKKDKMDASFGGSFSLYEGDHFGEVIWAQNAGGSEIRDHYYDGQGKKYDFNVFAKATYKINNKVSVFADVQQRTVNYSTSGDNSDGVSFEIDKDFNFFNPKAGVSYMLNKANNLYFSYARANREPSRSDFESNPDVKAEQLNDFELGWRFKNKNFSVSTNVYYMLYNEQLVLTGDRDDTGTPIRDNSGESYRLGLEIDAQVKLNNKFSIQPNVTLSSNKNKEFHANINGELRDLGSTDITFSPEIVASNAFIFQPIKKVQLSILSKYVGSQFMSSNNSTVSKLDSYFVNDFNASYEIKPKSIFNSIVLSAMVNNLFNEEYVSNGGYYNYDDTWTTPGATTTIEGVWLFPQATRNFLIGATLKF